MVTSAEMPYLSLKASIFSPVSTKLANLLILGNKKGEEKEEGGEDEETLDTEPTQLRRKVKKLTRTKVNAAFQKDSDGSKNVLGAKNELLSPLI